MLQTFLKYINFAWKIWQSNFRTLKNPYKLFIVVTKSCDSVCQNCSIWNEKPQNELTLEEYEKIAKNIGKNLSWLNISGGEPTNREDLIEIIKIFQKHCPYLLIVNFTTNGLRIDRVVKAAQYLNQSNIPIVGINVSIDGPEEIHIKLRGGNNSYQLAIKSLDALRKFKNIKVHASMTLFDQNAHLVEETFQNIKKNIKDFSRDEMNLNYSFHSKHFYQNAESNYENLKVNIFFKSINISVWNFSLFSMMKNIYLKKLQDYIVNRKNPIQCSALSSNVYISEHGEIYTCTIWNQLAGKLRESDYDLSLVLNQSKALELREKIKNDQCPNCWSPCEAFPTILDNALEAIK
jgi:sulfatase maturation enzyme AslB (radical SAM superfamily)